MNSFFKRILTACVAIAAALPSWAQLEPVKWSTEVKELEAGLYQIVFTAAVDGGWHIYDLGPYELGGPMATSFEFTPDASYSLEGGVYALAEAHREFDPIYEMEIGYYEKQASFSQTFCTRERTLRPGVPRRTAWRLSASNSVIFAWLRSLEPTPSCSARGM